MVSKCGRPRLENLARSLSALSWASAASFCATCLRSRSSDRFIETCACGTTDLFPATPRAGKSAAYVLESTLHSLILCPSSKLEIDTSAWLSLFFQQMYPRKTVCMPQTELLLHVFLFYPFPALNSSIPIPSPQE